MEQRPHPFYSTAVRSSLYNGSCLEMKTFVVATPNPNATQTLQPPKFSVRNLRVCLLQHDLKYREGHALCRTPTGSAAEELAPGRRRGEPRSPRSVAVCFPAALGVGPMLALTAGLLPRRDDAILRAPTRVEPFAARAASATPDSRAEGSLPAPRPWHGV